MKATGIGFDSLRVHLTGLSVECWCETLHTPPPKLKLTFFFIQVFIL